MIDGAELAEAIFAHTDDIETALADYEEAPFPRSEAAACIRQQSQHQLSL
jgi:hypothetical protein